MYVTDFKEALMVQLSKVQRRLKVNPELRIRKMKTGRRRTRNGAIRRRITRKGRRTKRKRRGGI